MAVTVTGKNEQLNHSHFTAVQVKRAITKQQTEKFRPTWLGFRQLAEWTSIYFLSQL